MAPTISPYPGDPRYGATRCGRVYRIDLRQPRPITPWLSRGYPYVSLSGGRKRPVHRIVAETFHGPCPPGMEAAHQDGVRTNVRADNLRWDTRKGNLADRVAHGTSNRGERHGMARLVADQVLAIRERRSNGERPTDLAEEFGVTIATISDISHRRSWAHV